MSIRYWVPSHVRVCLTQDGVVMLDAAQNMYFGVPLQDACALAGVVGGWPDHRGSTAGTDSPSRDPLPIAESLSKRHLLTSEKPTRAPLGCEVPTVDCTLTSAALPIGSASRITARHVINFLLACASAKLQLRFGRFEGIVRRVHRRKRRIPRRFDFARAVALTDVFRRLRAFVFTAEGHCLLHALSLTIFLARQGVPAAWVIGVKTRPWGAHSWVQHGDVILDSDPDKVWDFTPILAA